MLSPFSIIVAIDSAGGISKGDEIPWGSKEDARFFRDLTIGKRKNVVIMGRNTYESIPEESRPLEGRKCVIISRTWKQDAHPDISVYPSLTDALAGVGSFINSYEDVFITGGEQLYKEAVRDFGYLCKKIYVTKFKTDYSCDLFFPYESVKNFPIASDPVKTRDYVRYTYLPDEVHDEYKYVNLLKSIKDIGESKPFKKGDGIKSIFGSNLVFDIRDRIPLITTRRINFEDVTKDFIFMLGGLTDSRRLQEQKCKIYEKQTNAAKLAEDGYSWNEGDTGPNNGWCFKHWGLEYKGCDEKYEGGTDQFSELIKNIREDPFGKSHVLTAISPEYEKLLSITRSICFIQFNVSFDRKYLDCQIYQKEGDLFFDLPHNLALYSLLTLSIAHITQLKPRNLSYIIGNGHVLNNLGNQINTQIKRTPRPFPKLSFREATRIHELADFTINSFILEAYNPWPAISQD